MKAVKDGENGLTTFVVTIKGTLYSNIMNN
jgi:hypothetical protein